MKLAFRLTIVFMMITVAIGVALDSKLISDVGLVIMAFALAFAGIMAITKPKDFDWISPSWAEMLDPPTSINVIAGVVLIFFSIFDMYIAIGDLTSRF